MAAPKVVPAKCPTCGANLPVPPGVMQVTCRYCQNVIHVEHRKPPPNVQPFGMPGYVPSRTLYVDPDVYKSVNKVGAIIALVTLVPMVIIPIIIFAVSSRSAAVRVTGGKPRVVTFPASCSINEEIELSGDYQGTGPLIKEANHNCKIHIKNAKLKGSTLLKTNASNVRLTLENVTVETTEPMVKAGSNLKVKLKKSTLTSPVAVFDSETNLDLEEVVGSTIESKEGPAIKARYNLHIDAEDSKIRGKKAAIHADSSLKISMKRTEITSSDGPAIKTSSGLKLDANGGKIEGEDGAIVGSSGMKISATGLTLAAKRAAITATSGLELDLTGGSISSSNEAAIDGDSGMNIELSNVKITGADVGIKTSSGLKLKAEKKSQIVSTSGVGIAATSNPEITLEDASIEGASRAFKGTVNCKLKLQQGARIAGKQGAIEVDHNFELDGRGATIDGGSGPGIDAKINVRLSFKQGTIKGNPAIKTDRKPNPLELDGTNVVGGTKIPPR